MIDPIDPDYTHRRAHSLDLTRMAITACYRGECQQTAPHTAWAAYNAITEYVDHNKTYYEGKHGGISDVRMNSVIWGQGSQIKKKALDLLSVS